MGIYQQGWAALFSFILMMMTEKTVIISGSAQWESVLGLALICSAYGFAMQAVVQKYTTPETTGCIFSLEAVFSAIFAFIFTGEQLTSVEYAGAVLIFAGIYIVRIKEKNLTMPLSMSQIELFSLFIAAFLTECYEYEVLTGK